LEKVEPIFLDEIGPFEIRGEGFHDVFKMLIASGLSAYVVIRTNCLDEAKEKFLIKEYDLIWIETRNRKAEN
jgi:nucleoside-triphosphatase THEP1